MFIDVVQGKTCKRTTHLSVGRDLSYKNEKTPHIIIPAPGEEGQFARIVTMNSFQRDYMDCRS